MKKKLIFLVLIILLIGCSSKRYLLSDDGIDKRALVELINKWSANGDVTKKPMIIIDGKPFRFDIELKNGKLPISKNDIKQIVLLKEESGQEIYGDYAKGGVILITTNSYKDNIEDKNENENENIRLYIIQDGKVITHDEMKSIDRNDIDEIEVIRDKDKISRYTDEDYDVVIIINMK